MNSDSLSKKRKQLLVFIFILALLIAVLDRAGLFLKLYWSVWWFDIIMHFLGGFLVGLGSAWFYGFLYKKSPMDIILFAVFSGLMVGILWEIYELYIGIQPTSEPYPVDTTIDIIMDVAGAYIAGAYIKSILSKYSKYE